MAALLILNYDVHDVPALMQYRAAASPVVVGPSGGSLVASTAETVPLPEAPATGTHTVILRFDSVAAAQALYDSTDYQRLLPQRLAAVRPVAAMIVPTDE